MCVIHFSGHFSGHFLGRIPMQDSQSTLSNNYELCPPYQIFSL